MTIHQARYLRTTRAHLGITQKQLADIAGMKPVSVTRAELGKPIRKTTFDRLWQALNSDDAKNMGKRRPKSRAEAIRQIRKGGYRDFRYEGDVEAASIRGSAYQAEGAGVFRCERVKGAIRVWRVRA